MIGNVAVEALLLLVLLIIPPVLVLIWLAVWLPLKFGSSATPEDNDIEHPQVATARQSRASHLKSLLCKCREKKL